VRQGDADDVLGHRVEGTSPSKNLSDLLARHRIVEAIRHQGHNVVRQRVIDARRDSHTTAQPEGAPSG
jgi:hypothetical protein